MTSVPVVVATTEYRRMVRVIVGDRTKLLLWAAIVLFAFGPIALAGATFLPAVGREVAAGNVGELAGVALADAIAGAFAVAWIFFTLIATIRAVQTTADIDEPATLLISTSVRNTVVGKVGTDLLLFATWFLPLTAGLSAAFAYGAGSVLPVVSTTVAVVLVMATGVSVAFVVGVFVRHLLTVYEPIARYRTPLLVALAIAYVAAVTMGWIDRIAILLFDVLSTSPLGWPGHVLAVGVPNVEASTLAAVGAFVGAVVLILVTLALGVAIARIHWFSDPARFDDADDDGRDTALDAADRTGHESATARGRLAALLAAHLDRPVHSVTVTAIRRTRRAPIRMLYVAYPLFGALFFAQTVVETGHLPTYLAVLCCLYVVWGAGALFTLNPLGDLGRALPAVLTSTSTGRDVTRGTIVASTLFAVPIAIGVSVVAGLASPFTPTQTAILAVATVVGAVATPALATGVGSLFPRFGSVKLTSNREAVMPSKTAFVVYTLAIALPAASAVVLYVDGAEELVATAVSGLFSLLPVLDLAVTVPAVAITGLAWLVLLAGLASPLASYRYAIGRFDRFTLE